MKKGFILSSNQSIHIFEGSLAEVKADVLVSSDDNYLTASGGVARALSGIAGEVVEIERKQLVEKIKFLLVILLKLLEANCLAVFYTMPSQLILIQIHI